MKKIYTISSIICFFLLFSCNKQEENKNITEIKSGSNENKPATSVSSGVTPSSGSLRVNEPDKYFPQSKDPLKPEQLEKALPKAIEYMERSSGGKGSQNWKQSKISVASAQFTFKGGGLMIYVTDYANIGNVPEYELKEIKMYSAESKDGFNRLTVPNGQAFYSWSKETRSGVLYSLVANRFYLRIDATRLPKNIALTALYFYLNTDVLIQMADTNNPTRKK